MSIQTLHVFGNDYPGERSWELLDWCRASGASEFTVNGVAADGGSRDVFTAFDAIADAHRSPRADRYDLHRGCISATDLWRLNDETLEALRVAFPLGLFDFPASDAWFEDICLYRPDGNLLLGVITHEAEGVLRVTPSERVALDRLSYPYRMDGEWVGFSEAAT